MLTEDYNILCHNFASLSAQPELSHDPTGPVTAINTVPTTIVHTNITELLPQTFKSVMSPMKSVILTDASFLLTVEVFLLTVRLFYLRWGEP